MSQEIATSVAGGARWAEQATMGSTIDRKRFESLKRLFDASTTPAMLMVFLPLLVVIGLALLAQGRPLLYRHKRIGRGGKLFSCLKFRTMVIDGDEVLRRHLEGNPSAREEWVSNRKLKYDPRITALGRVLRKYSLDELPQLLNVLWGDMSLVGPRPIVPAEIVHYGVHIERYYCVRPGLTGAWQLSGRSEVSYNQRVSLDCHYIETQSIRRDISIMLMTIPAVPKSRGSY